MEGIPRKGYMGVSSIKYMFVVCREVVPVMTNCCSSELSDEQHCRCAWGGKVVRV
jgi:hypothetical protein